MRIKDVHPADFIASVHKGVTLGTLFEGALARQEALRRHAIEAGLEILQQDHIIDNVPCYEKLGEDKIAGFNALAPDYIQIRDAGIKSQKRAAAKIRSRFNVSTEGIPPEQIDASGLSDSTRLMFLVSTPKLADRISQHFSEIKDIVDTGWRISPSMFIGRKLLVNNGGYISEVQIREQNMHAAEQLSRKTYELERKITGASHHFTPRSLSATEAAELASDYNEIMKNFCTIAPTHEKTAADFQSESALEQRYLELLQVTQSYFLKTLRESPREWHPLYVALAHKQNALLPEELRVDPNSLPKNVDQKELAHYMEHPDCGFVVYAHHR